MLIFSYFWQISFKYLILIIKNINLLYVKLIVLEKQSIRKKNVLEKQSCFEISIYDFRCFFSFDLRFFEKFEFLALKRLSDIFGL